MSLVCTNGMRVVPIPKEKWPSDGFIFRCPGSDDEAVEDNADEE